ncbi:hypothetical protein ANN_27797 [Periplaneta americana]|uniref:DUF4371 domain-containing protein n=1 Tax=Periplaneta americana TaxID=6978 RepID=A0ABQ8RVC5_PERAM|nr:hypothetical protein ANN_27797 [Periplaneta americana]
MSGNMEAKLAAAEGTFAFYAVFQNHSFHSMNCISKLVQKLFELKVTCVRTKCKAIITNVLFPFLNNQPQEKLKKIKFVTIFTDASYHKEVKVFSLLVRYFVPSLGVEVKLIHQQSLHGEISDITCEFVINVLEQNTMTTKTVGFCADNVNTNFGGVQRKGKNNVFEKLKSTVG